LIIKEASKAIVVSRKEGGGGTAKGAKRERWGQWDLGCVKEGG